MGLNRGMAIDPWIQESPRCLLIVAVPEFQAAVQAATPAFTAAGLVKASYWRAPAGSVTETIPIKRCFCTWVVVPTAASEKAMVLDVPSVTALMALLCWQAKRPEYRRVDRFAPLPVSVVVPMQPS